MTSEDVIAIVDALCEKLGLAVDSVGQLVPELAAWKTAATGFVVVFCLVCCGVLIALAMLAYRKGTKITQAFNKRCGRDEYDAYTIWNYEGAEGYCAAFVLCIAAVVIFLMVAIPNACTLIGWITAPNAKAIEYILSLVG